MLHFGVASPQEMDAAATLLKLRYDYVRPQPQETNPLGNRGECRVEMTIGRGRALPNEDVTTSKFMDRHSVKVTSTPLKSNATNTQHPTRPVSPRVIRVVAPCSKNNGYIVKKNFRGSLPAHKNMSVHDMYLEERKRWLMITNGHRQHTKCTRDVGTQTEETHTETETKIAQCTERIKVLQEKLEDVVKLTDNLKFGKDLVHSEDDDSGPSIVNNSTRSSSKKTKSATSTVRTVIEELNIDEEMDEDKESKDNYELKEKDPCRKTVRRQSNDVGNKGKMIPIGCGNATVPARLLSQVNWNSYTSATRKLLTAIFPRSILATHSLTGKRSPAFPNKPAKKKLNSKLVDDIIQTVVQKCSVPEGYVRTSITTKCADESKMFRSRQNHKKTTRVSRKENDPSVTSSSSATSR